MKNLDCVCLPFRGRYWRFVLLPVAITLAEVHAQQSSPGVPTKDEVISLSPFTVSTDRDIGYLAQNTLAGSRLNTELKDTPAAISVFTAEFLSDIGAFDISEAMAYAVNVEFDLDDDRSAINGNSTINNYQDYRIRGLASSRGRNYFRTGLPTESAFLERIEDSRGPNSVLFGIAGAGGLINSMTKQARPGRAFRQASFTLMSYDSIRGTLDLNQPLIDGKLAVRLNTVYNETNTFRHWQYNQHERAHLAATYLLSDKTRIRADYERGQIDSNAPRGDNLKDKYLRWEYSGSPTFANPVANAALGLARQATARARYVHIANDDRMYDMRGTLATLEYVNAGEPIMDPGVADRSINIGGPGQDRFSRFENLSIFLEQQLTKKIFLEVAYNHEGHKFDRYDPQLFSPQQLEGDPNQKLNNGQDNPHVGEMFIEGGWHRVTSHDQSDTVRAMLSGAFDAGKFGNYRVAGMGEYEKAFAGGQIFREMWFDAATGLPAVNTSSPYNTQNAVLRRTYVTPGDWKNYYILGPSRGGGLFTSVPDVVSGRLLNSRWVLNGNTGDRESYSDLESYMAVMQARYFKNRLVVSAGYRRDSLKQYHLGTKLDPTTGEYIVARDDAEAEFRLSRTLDVGKTSTLGFVYHLSPKYSVFYNRSDNVSLPGSGFRLPDSGEPGNPIPVTSPRGETEDVGVALTFLDGRLHARATYYETGFVNQTTTSPDPVRSANERIMDSLYIAGLVSQADVDFRTNVGNQGAFDHSTKGVEVQVTANATNNWRIQVSFAVTDTTETNLFKEWRNWHELNLQYLSQFDIKNIPSTVAGRSIADEIEFYQVTGNGLDSYLRNDGQHKLGNRPYKANLFTRYNFSSGRLRGLYVGGGYRYQGKMFTGIDPLGNREEQWTAPIGQLDLMAGYSVRGLGKGRRLSFQLNILNALDETDPIIKRYHWTSWGEKRVLAMSPREGMTWRFTTNFEF